MAGNNPTEDEREARRARDDGDPDDMVTVRRGSGRVAYHEDVGCRLRQNAQTDDFEEVARWRAKNRGEYPCLNCVLDEMPRGGGYGLGHKLRNGEITLGDDSVA